MTKGCGVAGLSGRPRGWKRTLSNPARTRALPLQEAARPFYTDRQRFPWKAISCRCSECLKVRQSQFSYRKLWHRRFSVIGAPRALARRSRRAGDEGCAAPASVLCPCLSLPFALRVAFTGNKILLVQAASAHVPPADDNTCTTREVKAVVPHSWGRQAR